MGGYAPPYSTEDERWRAVRDRDSAADGYFVFVVRTTGLYSRPSCVARSARRENVVYFATIEQARAAGYRPCRRCRPDEPDLSRQYAAAVTRACRIVEESAHPLNLDDIARKVGFSRFHFHRVFKAYTGITPHAYLAARRAHKVRRELARTARVSDAIYSSGFSSNGHFYAASTEILGMTPTEFRSGGEGVTIRYATEKCSLGSTLVAASSRGTCAVLIGDDAAALLDELREQFPRAELVGSDPSFAGTVAAALVHAEPPVCGRGLLPARVQGVALQQRLRQALREAPAGARLPAGVRPRI